MIDWLRRLFYGEYVVLRENPPKHIPYRTGGISLNPPPKVVVFDGKLFSDTGRYENYGHVWFRIYAEGYGVHQPWAFGE